MAIDSALKRKAAAGAGRPWMRGIVPGTSGISAGERSAVGLAYPVATFANPSGFQVAWANSSNVMIQGGIA